MIKRTNKTIALLVTASSVISMVPAMGEEEHTDGIWALQNYVEKTSERLDAKKGSIENAVAYKDGTYIYEGYKDDNDTGIYLNNGTDEKLIEDVSEFDTNPKFEDKYVLATEDDQQYKIDLTDGTVSDEDVEEDLEDSAKSKLENKLSKTDRYSEDIEIESFNRLSDGEFDSNTWYEYTATGNSLIYDDILAVPENLAAGLTFTDEDEAEGKISGTVSITKAEDESDLDSYRVYYLDGNNLKVGDAIGTVDKDASSLQVTIADTDIPSGATQLGVYSVNSKGESETPTKITIVDKGAATVTYKSQIKIVLTAFWADTVIDGTTFSPSWGSNLPDALVQSVNDATFDGYTVVSAVSEHAYSDDGSIDNNNGKVTITLGTDQALSSVPDGFVTFNGSSDSYALSVELISDSAVPTNLAEAVTFTDEDTATGKISGTVSITEADDESDIDSYSVYYLDDNNEKVGDAIGTVDKGTSPLQVTIDDTDIPSGATQIGVYSVNENGESTSATATTLVDVTDSLNPRIQVKVYAFYGSITIADQTFNENIDWSITNKAKAEAVKDEIEAATFEDYTVESVSVTGTDDSPEMTVVLQSKDSEDATLPTLEFSGSDVSWEMNAKLFEQSVVKAYAFYGSITIADQTFNENIDWSITNKAKAEAVKDEIEAASFDDYTVKSVTVTGSDDSPEMDVILEAKEAGDTSLPTLKFSGSDVSWEMSVSLRFEEESVVETTTSAAVVISSESNTETTTSASVTFSNLLSSADISDEVVYYGYTDGEGNYIDCSKIANISIYNGERIVKIDNFNSQVTKGGQTLKVGLPTLVETIGQDNDFIYSIISVPVIGAQSVNGSTVSDTAVQTLYYLQKISKVKGDKDDDAYLPEKVESYQLNNTAGWDKGDNWSYMAAYYMLVGEDSSRKIKIVDGNIYVAHDDNDGTEVAFARIKLGKTKRITPVTTDDDGDTVVDTTKDKVAQPLVYEDTASSSDMDTWTMDHNGNVWAVDEGKIMKSAQGNEFAKIYTCDKKINHIDVYDDNNLIGWSDDEDIYITVAEGEDGATGNAVTKTGWHQLDNGTWSLYDLNGNQVKGWANMGSGWYYMNNEGVMQTGWITDNGKNYYLSESGMMKTGWINLDEKWYYLDNSGARQENTTIDGYLLDANGVWVK